MKNDIIYKLKNKVKLNIKGKNIKRFILKLNRNKIEILKIKELNNDEANIIVYKNDFDKIEKLKTIYNIDKQDEYGLIKIKKKINKNKYIIISIAIGYIVFIFLCNIIYEVDIIHSDKNIINFLKQELEIYGIKEKTIKKNYKQLKKIKEEIINKNKDKIEWLEIETVGTKYIVRVEPRIIKEKKETKENRNLIAKKDGIIKKIQAEKGQIQKEINNYVKKGDVIISGNIYDGETIKNTTQAEGKVFGEVWYEINITYPYIYNETKELNNKKKVLTINLFNKKIELANKPFKTKKIKENIILKENIFPLKISLENQIETKVIEQILTPDEAQKQAEQLGIEKIKNNLKEDEYIINYRIINKNVKENEIEINMFFSVYENITEYETIINEENME